MSTKETYNKPNQELGSRDINKRERKQKRQQSYLEIYLFINSIFLYTFLLY
jgi:hypothetical protein